MKKQSHLQLGCLESERFIFGRSVPLIVDLFEMMDRCFMSDVFFFSITGMLYCPVRKHDLISSFTLFILSCLHPHQCLLNVIAFDFSAGNSKVSHPSNLFRRFVWNFFRLENEHLNNCGEFRAVRDISVAPLNADDQTLLEQMMDQEDGVRNRQGKKYWKRSYSMSLRRPLLSSQYVI